MYVHTFLMGYTCTCIDVLLLIHVPSHTHSITQVNPEPTIKQINLPLFSFFFSSLYFFLLLPSLQNKIAVSLPLSLTFPPLSPSTPHIGGTPSLTPPSLTLHSLTTLHILPLSFLTLILHSLSNSVPQISHLTPSLILHSIILSHLWVILPPSFFTLPA